MDKKLPIRVKAVVDMQLATMGTFFNDVLNVGENLQMVSKSQPTPESNGGMGDASPADPG